MAMSPRLLRPVASGFNPKAFGTLALWLDGADRSRMFSDDAATTLSADNGQIAVYKDKAENYNLTQTTANNRPLVRANTKNGHSVLEFDGSNDGLASPALVNDWPAVTAFAVFNMDTTGVVGRLFERGQRIWFRANNALTFFYSGSSGFTTTDGSVVNGSWFYCTIRWTGVASGATGVQQRVNGASSGTGSGSDAVVSAANAIAYVGNRADNGRPFDGYMAELLIYSESLSDAAIAKIENHLATKWGIARAPQVSNADAQDWVDRVYANGGTVSAGTANAVNSFCDDIDAAGIRDRFYRLNLFCGTGLNACLVPLYRGQSRTGTQFGNATDTNNGPFVSADYSESTGLNSGSVNSGKNLVTGLTPDDVGVATGHLAVYSPVAASSAVGLSRIIGSVQSSPQQFYAVSKNNLSANISALWGGGVATVGGAMGAGLSVWQREASNVLRHYTNASLTATNTSNITPGASSVEFAVFTFNIGGTPNTTGGWFDALRGYSIGKHFTSGQVTDYYNAMLAFQTALGRNV